MTTLANPAFSNPTDSSPQDNALLAALAIALVEQPRATLQDLARAVGISKASLYRFCSTREALIDRLVRHSTRALAGAIQSARLEDSPPLDALRRLIANMLEHRELNAFLMYYWKETLAHPNARSDWETGWEVVLDAFFLRGQQQGVFRIDISAPAMTETWLSILIGLMDGERRGRIARAGLAGLVERAFLQGVRQD